MDEKNKRAKKIAGAILATSVIGLYFLLMILSMTYFQFTEEIPGYFGTYIFFILLFGIPLIALVVNLINRIKEIVGGEEDEASKY